jgi:hypothetical protein
MRNYFVSWFYVEPEGDDNFSPSAGGRSSSTRVQAIYWRCVYDLYKTALATNAEVVTDWIFVSNQKELPVVDGVDLNRFFADHQVKLVNVELTRKTPKDWSGAWRNQFYIFDILEYLQQFEGNFIVLDTDCVVPYSLKNLYRDVEQNGVVALTIDYPKDKNVNGCSLLGMREIYQECFGGEAPEDLVYSGGEICAVNSAVIPEILKTFDEIRKVNYVRYEKKLMKLTDEAHHLSLIYYHMKRQNNIGACYTKRMWTDLMCDTVEKEDVKLAIWHLPAEKKFGLQKLFYRLLKNSQIRPEQVLPLCEKAIWVTKPRFMRKVRWYYRYGMLKLKRLVHKQ